MRMIFCKAYVQRRNRGLCVALTNGWNFVVFHSLRELQVTTKDQSQPDPAP